MEPAMISVGVVITFWNQNCHPNANHITTTEFDEAASRKIQEKSYREGGLGRILRGAVGVTMPQGNSDEMEGERLMSQERQL